MNTKLMIGISIALATGACASIPVPNAALVQARSTVGAAEADSNVNRYAALDLEAAKSHLAMAEAAAAARKSEQIDQAAFLATESALLAQSHAAAKADDARVAAGQAERDQIRLAARTKEVNIANVAANAAMGQRDVANAESARLQADAERDQVKLAARTGEVNTANVAANAAMSQRDAANAESARLQSEAERDQARLAAQTSEANAANLAANAAMGQRDAANAESARLQAEVDRLNAKATTRGLVLTLGDLLFDTGKAELNSGAGRKLDQLAQFLTEHPNRRVQIDGFTDSVGTDAYNLDLSQRRADAVKSALLVRNIDSARVSTQGYAKAYPVASNTESGGRQLNRRVEVVIGGDNNAQIAPRT